MPSGERLKKNKPACWRSSIACDSSQHLAEELAQAAREKACAQAEIDFQNSSTVQAAMELRALFAKHEAERQAKRAQQAQVLPST